MIVKCINSSNFVAAFDHVIQDIKTLMREMSNVNVMFIKRSVNSVAHSLSRDFKNSW